MKRTSCSPGANLEEIERVYRARYRDFARMAQAVVGDAETAKDVVHDAFVSIVQSRSSFSAQGSLEGWIWRAVVNKARDHLRRTRPDPLDDDLAAPVAGSIELDRAAVRAAVSRLPERQRQVLFLHYFGDLDYRTIGEALGIQPGTVAATLHAARTALRSKVDAS
jgi:RNA polymerase sigma factor (sigma-70 family)